MPIACCVPGCSTGYTVRGNPSGGTLHFFSPRSDSISAWNKAIPRDFILKTTHRVCSRHFSEESIIKQDEFLINGEKVVLPRLKWSLRVGAVPEIFPNPPTDLTASKRKKWRIDIKQEEKGNTESSDTGFPQHFDDFETKKFRNTPTSIHIIRIPRKSEGQLNLKKWIDEQEEKRNTESSDTGFPQDSDDLKTNIFRNSPTSVRILDDIANIRITRKKGGQLNLKKRTTVKQEERGNSESSDADFSQDSDDCKTKKSRKAPTSRNKGPSILKKRRTDNQEKTGNTESSDTEYPQDSDDLKTKKSRKAPTFRNKEGQLNLTVSSPDSDKLKTENTFLKEKVRKLQRLICSYKKRLSKYEKPNKDLKNRNKKPKSSSKAMKNVQSDVIKKNTMCLRSTRRFKRA